MGTVGRSGERRHWPALLASIDRIMLAAVNGYSLEVLKGPIERGFGWTRAEISISSARLLLGLRSIASGRAGLPRSVWSSPFLWCC